MIKAGDKAPSFKLFDQTGRERTLAEFKGSKVVLYFYPKDDTPGCTVEANGFQTSLKEFGKAVVIGVSPDSVESHAKFAKKYGLKFTLLSDPEKKTIQDYGAWGKKKFMGREFDGVLRTTFLINEKGIVEKVFEKVTPEGHASEVKACLA